MPSNAAELTLVKQVINDDGGTAADTDWTLSATGPSTITGVFGDASITNAIVAPGTYALAETRTRWLPPERLGVHGRHAHRIQPHACRR